MKGIFIPEITVEMFRDGCLESIEALMLEGEIYDIEYDPKSTEPETNCSEFPNNWIPCTPDTMPEEHSEVLCCDAYGEQIIGMPYVDDDSNTGYSAESEAMYMVDCIAWQPLPEPYQPEEE